MQAIINFFEGIGSLLLSIIDFVISLFSEIIWMVEHLSHAVDLAANLFSWIPDGLLAIVLAIFSAVLIYKLLGREG